MDNLKNIGKNDLKVEINDTNYSNRVNVDSSGNYNISYNPSYGAARLSHELGHVIGIKNHNPIDKIVNRVANTESARSQFFPDTMNYDESGIFKSAKRGIQGVFVVSNERRASKRGLKLLKKSGSKNNYTKYKNELDNSLNTYKEQAKINKLIPLYNLITK